MALVDENEGWESLDVGDVVVFREYIGEPYCIGIVVRSPSRYSTYMSDALLVTMRGTIMGELKIANSFRGS